MGLLGGCSSVLVSPQGNFHLTLKDLFRNSERIYRLVFIPDFRADRICMAERCGFSREALDWLCKEGRACLKSNNRCSQSWRWVDSVSVFSASLCYRRVEAESASFRPRVLDLCLEGSDVIPSRGKMCRIMPHLCGATMWRS